MQTHAHIRTNTHTILNSSLNICNEYGLIFRTFHLLLYTHEPYNSWNLHPCILGGDGVRGLKIKYIVVAMKHPPSQMIWVAMLCLGVGGLFFIPPNTTRN